MNSVAVLMPTGNGGADWGKKPGGGGGGTSSGGGPAGGGGTRRERGGGGAAAPFPWGAEASTCSPRAPYSLCILERTPIAFWQWEQYVRMNATTTVLPLYWLMRTCLPWPR